VKRSAAPAKLTPLIAKLESALVIDDSPPSQSGAEGEEEDEVHEQKHDRLLTTEQHESVTISSPCGFLTVR
jgi:hypothetical protein